MKTSRLSMLGIVRIRRILVCMKALRARIAHPEIKRLASQFQRIKSGLQVTGLRDERPGRCIRAIGTRN